MGVHQDKKKWLSFMDWKSACLRVVCTVCTQQVLQSSIHVCAFVGNYVLQYLGNRLGLASFITQALVQVSLRMYSAVRILYTYV